MFDWLLPLLNADGDIGAESGVDTASAAGEQASEGSVDQKGVENQAVAEPDKQNNFEKAFAKRLSAEREKWEKEASEKYKDYDAIKDVAQYFVDVNRERGVNDVMTLREQIELERLQERAEKENLPPDVLKRIDLLEEKAAKGAALEEQIQKNQESQQFEQTLKEFCKDKNVDHMELWNYMHETQTSRPDVALRAMKAEEFEKKAAAHEAEVISNYLASKQAPRVEGSTGAAASQSVDTSKLSWKELSRHAAARLEAAKTPQ